MVMDIGSRDGLHSVMFRKLLPKAEIVAFEANPDNFHEMEKSEIISTANINLVNKAVTDENGQLTFNIIEPTEGNKLNKGTSSIREKKDEPSRQVTVEAITIDSFLDKTSCHNIALWIDVEGLSYEVLLGAKEIFKHVSIIHAEVETEEFWHGQKLKKDVVSLLEEFGFYSLARGKHDGQHDIVYYNKIMLSSLKRKIMIDLYISLILSYVRKWFGHIIGKFLHVLVMPELLRKK